MKSAFHNLGILKWFWHYLIMKAHSPKYKKWYYFVDKCLPFGASISCAHFQRVSNAVAHVVKAKTGQDLINYLDDFLFAAFLKALCDGQIQTFLDVYRQIGMPISMEKMCWSNEIIVFLGLLIDMVNAMVSIPAEKLAKGRNLILILLEKENLPASKRKLTVLQLQQLTGFLNFLCRAIVLGRAFT